MKYSWRNIFFFEGLVTMLIAGAAVYFMPQSPSSWKYLTPRQQYIAGERMQREHDAVRRIPIRLRVKFC